MIDVMVSSTTTDLVDDRLKVLEILSDYKLLNCVGVEPFNSTTYSGSSAFITKEFSRKCNIYILLLSNEYGFELRNGKSATESEFDSAYENDPTKILVFLKNNDGPMNSKQKAFIERVTNYYNGYWRVKYETLDELKFKLSNSIEAWLKDRANLNNDLNYFDHFIRIAKNIKPEPTALIYYRLTKNSIDIEYESFGSIQMIQFDKKKVYNEFWSCIHSLSEQFELWNKT